MRVARWRSQPVRLAYRRERRWSSGAERCATFLLLRIEVTGGAQGVAEGLIHPTWTGVSLRSLTASLEDLVMPALASVDLDDQQACRSVLDDIPDNRLAKALALNALDDLRRTVALASAAPGNDATPPIPLSWTVSRDAPDRMANDAACMAEAHGFRTFKLKGGQGRDADLAAVRAVQAAVGTDAQLLVDANGAYARDDARAYVARLADAGVIAVEDPCPLAPDAAFEALQAASPIPIVIDNACASHTDALLFMDRGARAFGLKPSRLGADVCRRIAWSAPRGCSLHAGLMCESDLGTLGPLRWHQGLAPAAAFPAETSFFLHYLDSLLTRPLVVRDGAVVLPALAPTSSLIDWAAVSAAWR